MFSGKSSELLRRLKRFESIDVSTLLVTSHLDTRSYGTHDGVKVISKPLRKLCDLIGTPEYENARVIAVDEAQFFTDLLEFVKRTERSDKTFIIAGLDADSNREPFGQILLCIPLCDDVVKLKALDARDGSPAVFSRKKNTGGSGGSGGSGESTDQIQIGGAEAYEAVSRKTWLYY